jgi:hypothetical protein
MAALVISVAMTIADDLFGTPQGSPRTEKLITEGVEWAERIMKQIGDSVP